MSLEPNSKISQWVKKIIIDPLKSLTKTKETEEIEDMSEDKSKSYRLFKVAKELNVSVATASEYLATKGFTIDQNDPNVKITSPMYDLLQKEYASDKKSKEKAALVKQAQKEAKTKTSAKTNTLTGLDLFDDSPSTGNDTPLGSLDALLTPSEKNKTTTTPTLLDLENLSSLDIINEPLIALDGLISTKEPESVKAEKRSEPIKTPITIADVLSQSPENGIAAKIVESKDVNPSFPALPNEVISEKSETVKPKTVETSPEAKNVEPQEQIKTVPAPNTTVEVETVKPTAKKETIVSPKVAVELPDPVAQTMPSAEKTNISDVEVSPKERIAVPTENVSPTVTPEAKTPTEKQKVEATETIADVSLKVETVKEKENVPVLETVVVAEKAVSETKKLEPEAKVITEQPQPTVTETPTPIENVNVSPKGGETPAVKIPEGSSGSTVENLSEQGQSQAEGDESASKESPFNIKVVGKIDLPEKSKKKKLVSYQEEKENAERKKVEALRKQSDTEEGSKEKEKVTAEISAPSVPSTPVAEKEKEKPETPVTSDSAPTVKPPFQKTKEQTPFNKDRERRDEKGNPTRERERDKDKSHSPAPQNSNDRKDRKEPITASAEQVPQKATPIPAPATVDETIVVPTALGVGVDAEQDESKVIRAKDHTPKLTGPKIIGKIDLPDPRAAKSRADKEKEERLARKKQQEDRNKASTDNASNAESEAAKRKRKRKRKSVNAEANASPQTGGQNQSGGGQAQVGNNPNRGQGQQGGGNRGGQGQHSGQGGGNRGQGGQHSGGGQGGGNRGPNTGGNQGTGGSNFTGRSQNTGGGQGGNTGGSNFTGRGPNTGGGGQGTGGGGNRGNANKPKQDIKQKDVKDKVKSTLFQIGKGAGRKRQTIRKDKRSMRANQRHMEEQERLAQSNVLEVTEFLTANELANLMDMSVNHVIAKCMELGMIVSINQRINSDLIQLIAEEFGYEVKFMSVEDSYAFAVEAEDDEALLQPRAPIVTVMGHVDHGKTSLLDYVRKANVIAGEAGGITQHIGAYEVELEDGRKIAFLDTPGHEAFTAMRARGAQITDIAIIVIAADDQVMPQTREAINHAQAAGVPMVFAINKVDKAGAQPERIKEQLAQMNLLVEDWGGKYQCQEISAKFGKGVNELLEKVLLEAEMLNLRSNPDKAARGTVIEAKLDKGRGVVTTVLVQNGTLKIGDVIIANSYYGRVKAMFDERMKKVKVAGPSTPVLLLGLDGVPQAGDKFQVMESDREARELANKRQQLLREQSIRMHKHITLEEIARRSKLGDFKELNIIVKGDVDGSVEALSDSLIKLSTEEVAVRIIMKGVGQISESDVLLASASNAIIIGFQVRPSPNARKVVQTEGVDVRIYSVIYNAINEIKDALEGLLRPTIEENIVGVAEVRDVFKVTKVGTIAGCMMIEGKINRNSQIRLVREGIVQFTGKISSLKRFKDDVREVAEGYECGISIDNFNDIKVGDHIEAFEQKEIRRKLE